MIQWPEPINMIGTGVQHPVESQGNTYAGKQNKIEYNTSKQKVISRPASNDIALPSSNCEDEMPSSIQTSAPKSSC